MVQLHSHERTYILYKHVCKFFDIGSQFISDGVGNAKKSKGNVSDDDDDDD